MAYDSPRRPKPTRRDMALLAIRVLDNAGRAAEAQPIALTEAVELALDWLLIDGIAEDHQAGRFVEALTGEVFDAGIVSGYMRETNMRQMIFTWQAEVRRRDLKGLPHGEPFPPDPFA